MRIVGKNWIHSIDINSFICMLFFKSIISLTDLIILHIKEC